MARNYLPRVGYYGIENLGEKELRKYYSNLRDIFQKQIKRFSAQFPEKARPFTSGGASYFGTIKELRNEFKDQESFIRAITKKTQALEGLTISRTKTGKIVTDTFYNVPSLGFRSAKISARDRTILDTLHESGFEHISKSTLKNFGNFMDEMRKQYGKRLPDSLIIAEFFDSLKYNTKKKGTSFLMELWNEFKDNGYKPVRGTQDLFSS